MATKIQHIRTLRLKVKAEGYAWLNAAAIEVNQVWNFANASSSPGNGVDSAEKFALSCVRNGPAPCRHRRRRLRWAGRRSGTRGRCGAHHHHRPAQSSFIPTAALPGSHRLVGDV